jgi:hypothetical protein
MRGRGVKSKLVVAKGITGPHRSGSKGITGPQRSGILSYFLFMNCHSFDDECT